MITRKQWDDFTQLPAVQWTMFGIGLLLVMISPLLGALPGPGGVIVFGLGLGMMLKTSMWAKRHYVRFKKWQPKIARLTDWGLMRKSPKRRAERKKQLEALEKLKAEAEAAKLPPLVKPEGEAH
jgi:hypothetical protein